MVCKTDCVEASLFTQSLVLQMLPFLVAYTLVLVLCCKVASIPYPSYSWVARELWKCSVHWLDDHVLILSQWSSLDPNIRFVINATLSSSPFFFSWQAVAELGPQLWKHWRQHTASCALSVSVASTILTLIRRLDPHADMSVTAGSVYDSLDAVRNAPLADADSTETFRLIDAGIAASVQAALSRVSSRSTSPLEIPVAWSMLSLRSMTMRGYV